MWAQLEPGLGPYFYALCQRVMFVQLQGVERGPEECSGPSMVEWGLQVPRKVPLGVCFHLDGQAVSQRAESPTCPPSFGPAKTAGPKAIP